MDKKKELLVQALIAAGGIVSKACLACGIPRRDFYYWKATDPEFADACEEALEQQKDFVEDQLIAQIKKGDTLAIKFYLSTKGRDRGYAPVAQEKKVDLSISAVRQLPPGKNEETADARKVNLRVQGKKGWIVKTLKQQGKYSQELSPQINIAAKLLVRAEMIEEQIFSSGHSAFLIEYSREGNERRVTDPLEKLYLDYSDQAQKALRRLGMNTDSKERKAEAVDGLSDFINSMRNERD